VSGLTVNLNPVAVGPLPTPPTAPSQDAPLLADPAPATGDGINDAMAMLYTASAEANTNQLVGGQAAVAARKLEHDAELKEEQDDLARQEKAEGIGSKGLFASVTGLVKDVGSDIGTGRFDRVFSDTGTDVNTAWHSPNFWHDVEFGAKTVGEIAAMIGSAAATAVTFGGAAPGAVLVTALALSAAGQVESNVHLLEKVGVDAKVDACVGGGLCLAGAAMGGIGAAVSSAPATISAFTQTAQAVGTASQTYGAAADLASSGAHVKNGYFAAAAQDASADATSAENRMQATQRTIDMIVDAIQDASESHDRAMKTLAGAMKTNADTLVVAGSGTVSGISGRMA
jgi:hypothetical protein